MIANGHDIIRAGYANGTRVTDIARQCDSTPGAVRVMAHRMGLRARRYVDVRVPVEKQDDYRHLTGRKGLPAGYVAKVLGLEGFRV